MLVVAVNELSVSAEYSGGIRFWKIDTLAPKYFIR